MNDSVEYTTENANEAAPGVPPTARLLLRIVYIMGIILVLLFLTLIGGIIYKSTQKSVPKPVPPAAALNLSLPEGTDIRSAEVDGDRLVLNTGREVIVIDIRKNAIISRIAAGP